MPIRLRYHLLTLALLVSLPAVVHGQEAPETGFRAEFLQHATMTHERLVSLANAIPEEKYTWRPGEGVRSVSEVFMHIADANYMFPQFFGTPTPEGFEPGNRESTYTSKDDVIRELEESFKYLQSAVLNVSEADQDRETVLFGNNTSTYRGALLLTTRHTAEHFGQITAYARMNDVIPPWSQQ